MLVKGAERKDIVRAVSDSGYPAPETLEEFRAQVAEPILRTPTRPHAVRGTRHPGPGNRGGGNTFSASLDRSDRTSTASRPNKHLKR